MNYLVMIIRLVEFCRYVKVKCKVAFKDVLKERKHDFDIHLMHLICGHFVMKLVRI